MSLSNQEVSALIISFLKNSLAKDDIPEDNRESIEFAIESIADAYDVNTESLKSIIDSKFNGSQLQQLLAEALSSNKASSTETVQTAKSSDTVPIHIDQEEAGKKEQAETLKLEGNRAMARKDFDEAIKKYTEAINLIPTNAVFYSNRAAAYSSVRQHELAVQDAETATKVEPTYAKAWSRLGLAKYALGDPEGALEAYEQGLNVEGETPSDAMKRGFETAKKRVAQKLADSLGSSEVQEQSESNSLSKETSEATADSGAGAGGLPDFANLASMFGGGAGGAGGLGGLAGMMNNPQVMQAAQQMMQNPDALNGLLSNPKVKEMAQSLGLGGSGGEEGGNGLEDIMNNPMLQNLAKQFMGGSGKP